MRQKKLPAFFSIRTLPPLKKMFFNVGWGGGRHMKVIEDYRKRGEWATRRSALCGVSSMQWFAFFSLFSFQTKEKRTYFLKQNFLLIQKQNGNRES